MTNCFPIFILSVFSVFANAEFFVQSGDPRFSFEGAQQAFRAARAPSPAELGGVWKVIGQAHIQGVGQDSDGYFPDGRLSFPGRPGFFYWNWSYIEKGRDSFGSSLWSLEMKTIGAETGRLYYERVFQNVQLGSAGVQFYAQGSSSSGTCSMDVECRLVQNVSMLLCEIRVENSRRDCVHAHGTIAGYIGMQKGTAFFSGF